MITTCRTKLRTSLIAICKHQIVTASNMGWGQLKNGELLLAAEENGVEVFVTGDQSLVFEQNLAGRRLAIVVLSANNWPIIKNHTSLILAAVENSVPGSCRLVDCGTFSRRKPSAE